MFDEAQLYAPVTEQDGEVRVQLADDHPGANDPSTARAATRSRHARWAAARVTRSRDRATRSASTRSGARSAASSRPSTSGSPARSSARRSARCWTCPTTTSRSSTRSARGSTALTGFRFEPAAGVVAPADFYGDLADGVFHSTQYLRTTRSRSTRRSPTSSTS